MKLHRLLALAFFPTMVALFGCAAEVVDSAPVEQTDTVEEALAGGCRTVCPKCHPGEVCPMIACYVDCHEPPPHCVETMMCPIGYSWSQTACTCVAK